MVAPNSPVDDQPPAMQTHEGQGVILRNAFNVCSRIESGYPSHPLRDRATALEWMWQLWVNGPHPSQILRRQRERDAAAEAWLCSQSALIAEYQELRADQATTTTPEQHSLACWEYGADGT